MLRFARAMTDPADTLPVAAARRRQSIRWSQETIAIVGVGVPILVAVLGVLWNTFSLDDRITSEVEDIRGVIREEHIEIREAMRLEHIEIREATRRGQAEIRQALHDHANR